MADALSSHKHPKANDSSSLKHQKKKKMIKKSLYKLLSDMPLEMANCLYDEYKPLWVEIHNRISNEYRLDYRTKEIYSIPIEGIWY